MQSRSFGTHDGSFHADEVSACALLLLTGRIDRNEIYRTRDSQVLARCEYVCDVGGIYDSTTKRFDHHQVEYNGTMSSAGMILLYLRDEGDLSEREYCYLDENLISGIDAIDNGYAPPAGFCSFSHVISNFRPFEPTASQEKENLAFVSALDFTLGQLERLRARFSYLISCEQVIEKAMEGGGECLFFDQEIPWQDGFFALGGEKHPSLFLIMPAGSHWKLRGIPPSREDRMNVRQPLPAEWAGLLEDDLQRVSGIPGGIFCHKGRFVSVWETKDDALRALEYTLGGGRHHGKDDL